jgi:hypothetical protein
MKQTGTERSIRWIVRSNVEIACAVLKDALQNLHRVTQ